MGVEPTWPVWKTGTLPLGQGHESLAGFLIRPGRFEKPAHVKASSRGGNRTHNHPVNSRPLYRLSYPEISAPGGNRTHTPRLKRPLLDLLSFEGVQCGGTELNRRLRVGMASGCRYPTAAFFSRTGEIRTLTPRIKSPVRCRYATVPNGLGTGVYSA